LKIVGNQTESMTGTRNGALKAALERAERKAVEKVRS
jgi:hypothetical protein